MLFERKAVKGVCGGGSMVTYFALKSVDFNCANWDGEIRITVRFVKLCASEGESPSRLAGQTAGVQR